jgi:NAD+ diphosphatase
MDFRPALSSKEEEELSEVYWLFFHPNGLLTTGLNGPQLVRSDYRTFKSRVISERFLGYLDGYPVLAAAWGETTVPADLTPYNLRKLYGLIDDSLHQLAVRASHLVYWDRTQRFCGVCGAPTVNSQEETAKICTQCGHIAYPRIAPAIIVAIIKGDQILLARSSRFTTNFYSVIAGFVEPGETLEECVRREIREEVGLEVCNIRYFSSQPWPFPDSLMIGFTADYQSGEITVDQQEILAADWFVPENFPEIPGQYSVARKLIDWFIEQRKKDGSA